MNKKEYFFSINNIFTFKIIRYNSSGVNLLFNRMLSEYDSYKICTDNHKTDLIISFYDNLNPNLTDTTSLEGGTFYVKENYIFLKDSYKTAKWEAEIDDLEKNLTSVNISANKSGYLFVGGYIIDFLIRYKMLLKGYPFIHSGALSLNDQGYVLAARSGTGKTVITSGFIKKGYKILADNFVFLNNGTAYSYKSRINIFYYNLTKEIKKKLNFKTKIFLKLKYLLYIFTFKFIKIFTPVSPSLIFGDKMVESAKLKNLLLMVKGKDFNIEDMSKENFLESLIHNNQLDAFPFYNYLLQYSFVFPNSIPANYWNILKNEYQKNIDICDISSFKRITLPEYISEDTLNKIESIL